jgi:tRNA (guanine-N7-)-methyltransferase
VSTPPVAPFDADDADDTDADDAADDAGAGLSAAALAVRARLHVTDRPLDAYGMPDLNPYLKLHRDYGPPVVTAAEAVARRSDWSAAFGRSAPLHLEVGPGNGFFLSGMARMHPEWNWLGVEIRFKRVILCAKKIRALGVENARVARYDAFLLDDLIAPGTLDGLYVHHPDPWSRERDEKHRLIGPHFLSWAAAALRPGARFRVKTDHLPHVERLLAVLDALPGAPFRVLGRSDDIVRDGTPWPLADDVETNYQRKFRQRGLPVYAVWMERVPGM